MKLALTRNQATSMMYLAGLREGNLVKDAIFLVNYRSVVTHRTPLLRPPIVVQIPPVVEPPSNIYFKE